MTKGTVLAVKQRENGYSVNLDDGEWYSGFGKCLANKGDIVDFEFKKSSDDKWNNLTKLEVKDKAVSSGTQTQTEKTIGVLTSYAKDEVVAKIQYLDKLVGTDANVIEAFWKEANKHVWDSYNYFKDKLKGEPKKPEEEVPRIVSSEQV